MKSSLELYYHTVVDAPVSLEDVYALKRKNSVFIAGGTLLQLNWEAGQQRPHHLISSHKLESLQGIGEERSYLRIGASTLLSECIDDLNIQKRAKILSDACTKIAAPAVRNRGTLGGNICSRVGDSIPALLALNAELQFFNGESVYTVPLSEWITKSPLSERDLLLHINIPLEKGSQCMSFFQKIGRRESFTAAIISTAGWLEVQNGIITNVRIAIGGGSHQPQTLADVENLLLQKSFETLSWGQIQKGIENGFTSYSDPFVTDSYRRKAAANIITANLFNLLKLEHRKGEDECN